MSTKLDWLKGEPDREYFKQLLTTSKPVLDKLLEICYNKRKSYDESKYSKPDYNDSNWAINQADTNGYVRALTEVIKLIENAEE